MKLKERPASQDADALYERALRIKSKDGRAGEREAVRLLKKAALMGHPDALHSLGVHFRDGRGVRRNLQLARRYFEAAAEQGDEHAMTSLGRLLLEVGRTAQDRKTALAWIGKAAKRGDWAAPHFLGRAAEEEGDWRIAEKWYRRGLEDGDFSSGYRLAKHYLDCLHRRLQVKGISILRRTIQRSDIDPAWGYTELAKCYLHGIGVPRSRSQAVKYLKRAAAGDPEARDLLLHLKKRKR